MTKITHKNHLQENLRFESAFQDFLLTADSDKPALAAWRESFWNALDRIELELFDIKENENEFLISRKIKKIKRRALDAVPNLTPDERLYLWEGNLNHVKEITTDEIDSVYTTCFTRDQSGRVTHFYYVENGTVYELERFTDEILQTFQQEEECHEK
ncbi:MAG: hypothetical protein LBQ54_07390 [Planctomycetaceae bacterium]|jgi:hypothetical protein|nr:hypothetical protein [Planctomycetaceae bacterium]